ncbi:MAG: metal/formaldehyde-sensitive transcriptional repressor [Polyangiales bacterium]
MCVVHTARDKKKLIARVRRIRGQLEAAERAIEDEKGCAAVMNTVAAARGALNGLVAELIEDHVRFHVLDPDARPSAKRRDAANELVDIVRAYVK